MKNLVLRKLHALQCLLVAGAIILGACAPAVEPTAAPAAEIAAPATAVAAPAAAEVPSNKQNRACAFSCKCGRGGDL